MNQADLTRHIASFFAPLSIAISSPAQEAELLRHLGYVLPSGVSIFDTYKPSIKAIQDAIEKLAALIGTNGESADSRVFADMIDAVSTFSSNTSKISALLPSNVLNSSLVTNTDFLEVFTRKLFDFLIIDFLNRELPATLAVLRIIGLVEIELLIKEGKADQVSYVSQKVNWEQIPKAVADPWRFIKDNYGWNTENGLRYNLLIKNLLFLARTMGLRSEYHAAELLVRESINEALGGSVQVPLHDGVLILRMPLLPLPGMSVGVDLYPIEPINKPIEGLGFLLFADANSVLKFKISPQTRLDLDLGGYLSGFGLAILPEEPIKVFSAISGSTPGEIIEDFSANVNLRLIHEAIPGLPLVFFGTNDSTRMQASTLSLKTELQKELLSTDFIFCIETAISQALIVVQTGDGDGFLQKLLPKNGVQAGFDFLIGWSTARGLYFRGAGGLAVTLAIHKDILGVLKIETIDLAILVIGNENKDTSIELMGAVSAAVKLGPFSASVERIGLRGDLTSPESGGNLGVANFGLGFKPPDGASMSLKAKAITGGGYLFFDSKNEQYAGVLHLAVQDKIALTIIGILTTRLPDGRKGFSLLLIITAEFPPIQLGFGFVLTGVGGLICIHRTMVVDALRSGVRTGGLNAILFPKNPVENALKIISDLKSFFPPAEGRFIFGPMAQLAWGGAYPLLTLELGILIELPSPVRLALLGRITLALPKKEKPEDEVIVYIKMDILGVLDFEKGDLSIDATLYDSRIASFPISGDMALRFSWGAKSDFGVSVGGFHPAYNPPPNFPILNRLSIDLSSGENLRLRAETYLAVTTAAAMVGARLDAYAAFDFGLLGLFSVEAYLGFDALVRFQPFSFMVGIYAGAALRRNGKILFAVDLSLTLSGPKPMEVNGFARFEFLGKHEIAVSATFGDPGPADQPLPTLRPVDYLFLEIGKASNWSAQLPPEGQSIVTLREMERKETVVLAHPLGRLTIRQQVVPLKTEMSRFGEAQVVGPRTFDLAVNLGSDSTNRAAASVRDSFAPGMFSELTDDAKLSQPAFVALPSGYEAIGIDVDIADFGQVQSRTFGYEETVIDNLEQKVKTKKEERYFLLSKVLDAASLLGGPTILALQETGAGAFAGPADQGVSLAEPVYVVTSVDTLARREGGVEASHYEAVLERKQLGLAAAQWQVVTRAEAH
jgi:hypothetical protein